MRWRTIDIVVAAALAVAFGVVFWAWNTVWEATKPVFVAAPPAQYIISGVWLIPAVLGGLIIRKPGASLFTELVAATVSAILGSHTVKLYKAATVSKKTEAAEWTRARRLGDEPVGTIELENHVVLTIKVVEGKDGHLEARAIFRREES